MKIILMILILGCQHNLTNRIKVGGRKSALVIINAGDKLNLNGLDPNKFVLGERDSYILKKSKIVVLEDAYEIEEGKFRSILIDNHNSCELDPDVKKVFNISYDSDKNKDEFKFVERNSTDVNEDCFIAIKNKEAILYNLYTSYYYENLKNIKSSFKNVLFLESDDSTKVIGIKSFFDTSDLFIEEDKVSKVIIDFKWNEYYKINNDKFLLNKNDFIIEENCIVEYKDNNINIYRKHGTYKFDEAKANTNYIKKEALFIESNEKSSVIVIKNLLDNKDLIIENGICKLGKLKKDFNFSLDIDGSTELLTNSKSRIQKRNEDIELYDKLGCAMYNDFYSIIPKLKNEGFDCIECINLDRNQMDDKFNGFVDTNYQNKLIYYTGHGSMQNCREALGTGALVPKVEDIKCKNLFIILDKCSVVSNLENLYCNPFLLENCCFEECIDLLKHNGEKKIVYIKASRNKPLHSTGSGPDDYGKLSKIIVKNDFIKNILHSRNDNELKSIKNQIKAEYPNVSMNYTLK